MASELDNGQKLSLLYHNIFDYPLTKQELVKWRAAETIRSKNTLIELVQGFYLVKGRTEIVAKRIQREETSKYKFQRAKQSAKIISSIPTVKLVAISGSLAMYNAAEESDIDLLIVTSAHTLWLSRFLVYFTLWRNAIPVRKSAQKEEKDLLCLNLWMDETDLEIKEKNIYTAHELAQLVPLINKNNTFEKLLVKNTWLLDFWPNAVRIHQDNSHQPTNTNVLVKGLNLLSYQIQKQYMKNKITRELVTPTRAFFHPVDWGKKIHHKLGIE